MVTTDWRNRSVLVTGGSGFAGRHLTLKLTQLGATVHCLSRRAVQIEGAISHPGDIRNADLVFATVKTCNPDTVFHLAAQPFVGEARLYPMESFETTVRGTWLLLDACRQEAPDATIVLASSDAVYGDQRIRPSVESNPLDGRHPYEVSKVCEDIIGQSYALTYEMSVGIARLSNIFGPGDTNWGRIVPGTFRSAYRGESPVIRSDGSPLRDYLHVDDLVTGLLLLASYARDNPGKANLFNLGSGRAISVLDMTRMVLTAAGRFGIEPDVRSEVTSEIKHKAISTEAARTRLGWEPAASTEQRLAETASWYREHVEV